MKLLPTFLMIALGLSGLSACSSKDTSTGGSGGGSGGTGGGSGGALSPSAKPECVNPDAGITPTPEPRADSAGALNADGRAFVLFGGDVANVVCGQTPTREHVGDTWLLDTPCGGWNKLAIPGPSPRARHSMAFDPATGRAILFGGRYRMGDTGPYTNYNDVWAFDFAQTSWSEIGTSGPLPSPRSNAATAIVGSKLVVFGGNASTSGLSFTPLADLFVLDLTTNVWTELKPAGAAPAARLFHALAAHPSKNTVYLHSGGDTNAFTGPFLLDTWAFDLDTSTWTKLADGTPDGFGRIKFGMWSTIPEGASEPRLFVLGGHDDGVLGNRNDILSADLGASPVKLSTWNQGDTLGSSPASMCNIPADFVTIDENSPERRSAFAFGALPNGSAAVIFGGDSDCGRLSDVHWYDTREKSWTPIRATLPGLACGRTGSSTCTNFCQ